MVSNNTSVVTWTGDFDLTNVSDYLVNYPFSINLESNSLNFSSLSNRGFSVGVQYPGLAFNFEIKDKIFINFSSANSSNHNLSTPLIIWKITADSGSDSSSHQSDWILSINVTLAESLEKTKAKLNIYDSISLRSQSVHSANGNINQTVGFFVGSIKSAFIVYDYTDSLAAKTDFSLNITIQTQSKFYL